MSRFVKPLAASIAVTTANTVYDSTLVRAVNNSTRTLVTVKDGTDTLGSFVMLANSKEYIYKSKNHTIEANNTIDCTPVAYF